MSAEEKYFYYLIHKACQILSTFTISALIFLILATKIPILTDILQHIIISSIHFIGYTALFKTLHIRLREIRCHTIMIHMDYILHFIFLGF